MRKGYKHTDAAREKMRLFRTGKKHSPETLRKMGDTHIGQIPWNKKEQIRKVCLTCSKVFFHKQCWGDRKKYCSKICFNRSTATRARGPRSGQWKGGVTPLHEKIRASLQYSDWRQRVFQRDDYTCQGCGERGGRLNADHELPFCDFPDLRFEVLNGRTFCEECHRKYGWSLFRERNPKVTTSLYV